MAGLGDSEFGGLGGGSESGAVGSLGRISGKLLKANLQRNGVPLSFQNKIDNTPVLYLDTENMRVGVNTDSPVYDLDINLHVKTVNAEATTSMAVDNIVINTTGFSTLSGPLYVEPSGHDSTIPYLSFGRMTSDNLEFNDNFIGSFSNSNIVLDPNASGIIDLQSRARITGDLSVTGNIDISGNLSAAETIYVGDSKLDVVIIGTDFKQGIIPGEDNAYDLGEDANDSSARRWGEVWVQNLDRVNNHVPSSAVVSEQQRIDGVRNQITASQSNEDLVINPDTGITYVEGLKIQGNNITNLVGFPMLDPSKVAAGILEAAAGNTAPEYNIWNQSATGLEVTVTGPGSTVFSYRTSKLGDIRNDPDNPGVLDANDATLASTVGNNLGGTTTQQIWYRQVMTPTIKANSEIYDFYSNGNSLSNLPISLISTGTGYVQFTADNAIVIPYGTSAERQYLEVGETRWNTDLNYLECFDGNTYIISTGAGEVVSADLMTELAITRALVLG